jgi:hypothetical protein
MAALDIYLAKLHLRVIDSAEDDLIVAQIESAITAANNYTGQTYSETDMPAPVLSACLLILGHLYGNRENVVTGSANEIPMGARFLLDPYRSY